MPTSSAALRDFIATYTAFVTDEPTVRRNVESDARLVTVAAAWLYVAARQSGLALVAMDNGFGTDEVAPNVRCVIEHTNAGEWILNNKTDDVWAILKAHAEKGDQALAALFDEAEGSQTVAHFNAPPGSAGFTRISGRIAAWGISARASYNLLSSLNHPSLRSATVYKGGERLRVGAFNHTGSSSWSRERTEATLGNAMFPLAAALSEHLQLPGELIRATVALTPDRAVTTGQIRATRPL